MDAADDSRQLGSGQIIRAFLMLLGYGILWGWLWFTATMTIPLFYVVAQAADLALYGFLGTHLCRQLERFVGGDRARQAFGILGVLVFYLGNRLIALTLIIGSSSFTEDSSWRAAMLFESLVLLAGFMTATGLWKPTGKQPSHNEDTTAVP